MMHRLEYSVSQGVQNLTNQATIEEVVKASLQKFFERKVELKEDSIYCCRSLISKTPDGITDPELVAFVLQLVDGKPQATLLMWKEAEERGIDKYLLELINKGGKYTPGPGRLLFPDKVPMGGPHDEIH